MSNNVLDYLRAIQIVIIVSQGASVTQEKPDKDKESILWGKIREVFLAGHVRFNDLYHDALETRTEQNLYEGLFDLTPITKEQWDTLSSSFSENPTKKEIDDNFKEFKKHQATCRNIYGPEYQSLMREKHSGEYNDSTVLLKMRQKAACTKIESNHTKATSKFKTAKKHLLEQTNGKELFDEAVAENEITLAATYDNQKEKLWKTIMIDSSFLTFVILGNPGSNNCAIVVPRNVPNWEGRTKSGRRAIKGANSNSNDHSSGPKGYRIIEQESNSRLSEPCHLKTEELNLKAKALTVKIRQNRYISNRLYLHLLNFCYIICARFRICM